MQHRDCGRTAENSGKSESKTVEHRSSEDSDIEYDPSHDDLGEEDLFDDDSNNKRLKDTKKTCTQRKKRTIEMPPGGMKPRSKRVYAEPATTRTTRSHKSIAQPKSSLMPSDISLHNSSLPQVTQARDDGNFDGHTQTSVEADGPDQHHGNTRMETNGGDAIVDSNIELANEDDGLVQLDGGLANGVEGSTQHGVAIQMVNEGEVERRRRGPSMGHGLQRLNRARRGKLPLVIHEGKTRPVVPLVAAKFATECNIIVRNHVPILKHWKDYKKQPALFELFIAKHSAKFDINISDEAVKMACSQMMKVAIRQQRYKLKKKYFDPFPLHLVTKTSIKSMTNEQWNDLVESWTNPKKMETCEKNKENRGLVKFHQAIGSRSYAVVVENLGDKFIDQELDALDLFKECHYSKKKKGYTSAVQLAITEMENKMSAHTEGEEPMSATQVVADVLAENTKKNQFLRNVGIHKVHPRTSVQNLEAQLEAEKRDKAELAKQVMCCISKCRKQNRQESGTKRR